MAAISRAIYFNARILIMDEPTAALGPEETAMVGALGHQLKADGVGIFLITHDLPDVFSLSDRLAVMKTAVWWALTARLMCLRTKFLA